MKKKIQDKDSFYEFLKIFVDWSVRSSFRIYQVEGRENIPLDGSVIWAANHTNALMDPMVLLSATKESKVFVARADVFKKKWVIKVLTFLKVMPIFRIRDGIKAVKHNDELIAQATDILLDGVPFVIFPEATHRPKHSLLRLSKGIFHIAESVINNSKDGKPVYILPIGIEYADYFRFRTKVLVNIGKPIDVTEFVANHKDEPVPVVMLQLRDLLTERMAEQIVYIPDDDDYDAIWEYTKLKAHNPSYFDKVIAKIESQQLSAPKGMLRMNLVDKYAVAQILEMRKNDPEESRELFAKIDKLRVWRIQNGISVKSIAHERKWLNLVLRMLLALLGAPYYLFSAVVSSINWIPVLLALRGVKDDAFYNTARYGVRLAMAIPALIIWSALYFILFDWIIAALLLLLTLPTFRYLYDYGLWFRRLCSDVRWKFKKRHSPDCSFLKQGSEC